MNYSVIIRPEAEADLAETFLWYEDKRQGLGFDFLLQIEAGLKVLERTPAIHPLGYKRRAPELLKKRLRTASQ